MLTSHCNLLLGVYFILTNNVNKNPFTIETSQNCLVFFIPVSDETKGLICLSNYDSSSCEPAPLPQFRPLESISFLILLTLTIFFRNQTATQKVYPKVTFLFTCSLMAQNSEFVDWWVYCADNNTSCFPVRYHVATILYKNVSSKC